MIDSKQLAQMSQQRMEDIKDIEEIEDIDREQLIDISSIMISDTASQDQKIDEFLEKIQYPYCFLCKETPIRICFSEEEDAPSLEECLTTFLIRSHA